MEQKIDKLTSTLVSVQDLIIKSGNKGELWGKSKPTNRDIPAVGRDSVTTIYKNALSMVDSSQSKARRQVLETNVPTDLNKHFSSSSEEDTHIDTSDELIEFVDQNLLISAESGNTAQDPVGMRESILKEPQPGTSSGKRGYSASGPQMATLPAPTMLTRGELMVRDAEASRA